MVLALDYKKRGSKKLNPGRTGLTGESWHAKKGILSLVPWWNVA
jgi:hypothetical protein